MTVTVTKYFSYHQKYMLRKHDWLLKALKLDNESLITSSAAARINGYVGGYGDEVKNMMHRCIIVIEDRDVDVADAIKTQLKAPKYKISCMLAKIA